MKSCTTGTALLAVGLLSFGSMACNDGIATPTLDAPDVVANFAKDQTGNGTPSGWHFNLNLIGMSQEKAMSWDGPGPHDNGHRIFIPFEGKVDIMLREGDYQVIDPNGTDGEASFQLPDPDDGSGRLAYSVWIRPVAGKGNISFQSCFTEFETASVWCYAGELVQNLTKNNKFRDVSRDLLQVCADTDTGDGTNLQLVPLFSDLGEDYFWHVDNKGMRNTQMRFYPLSTTEIGGACTRGGHPGH
jgi:hypothetical protein